MKPHMLNVQPVLAQEVSLLNIAQEEFLLHLGVVAAKMDAQAAVEQEKFDELPRRLR